MAGTYGKNNLKQRHLIRVPFEPNMKAVRHLLGGMKVWLKLEAETMFTQPIPALPDPMEKAAAPRVAKAS